MKHGASALSTSHVAAGDGPQLCRACSGPDLAGHRVEESLAVSGRRHARVDYATEQRGELVGGQAVDVLGEQAVDSVAADVFAVRHSRAPRHAKELCLLGAVVARQLRRVLDRLDHRVVQVQAFAGDRAVAAGAGADPEILAQCRGEELPGGLGLHGHGYAAVRSGISAPPVAVTRTGSALSGNSIWTSAHRLRWRLFVLPCCARIFSCRSASYWLRAFRHATQGSSPREMCVS